MADSVQKWSLEDVSIWLRRVGLDKFAELFAKHEIDGMVLLTMTEKDLVSPPMNIATFGSVRKFGVELEKLKEATTPKKPEEDAATDAIVSSVPVKTFNGQSESSSSFVANGQSFQNKSVILKSPTAIASNGFPSFEQFSIQNKYFAGFNEVSGESFVAEEQNTRFSPVSNQAVMMKGTFIDHVIKMEESLPEFSWRYQSRTDLAREYIHKPMHVEAVLVLSPAEFYVQPRFVVEKAQKLLDDMTKYYEQDAKPVPSDRFQIFENMPCAVYFAEEPGWYRGIVQEQGLEDARVVLVDWGNSQFVKLCNIKPLTLEFGRFPILALRCRVQDVRERSLEQKVVNGFKREMENLNHNVTIIPQSISDDVVMVTLHNCNTMEDIGKKYLPKEPLCPPSDYVLDEKLRKKQALFEGREEQLPEASFAKLPNDTIERSRIDEAKCKAEKLANGMYGSDLEAFLDGAPGFDDVDSDDEDWKPKTKTLKQAKREIAVKAQGKQTSTKERPDTFTVNGVECMKIYPKQAKPPKGMHKVEIVKVHSAREIYVRSELQSECLALLSNVLKDIYEFGGTPLPEKYFVIGTPCAYRDIDGRWLRGCLAEMTSQEIVVTLVDYGRAIIVNRSKRDCLKALHVTRYGDNDAQLYKCKLHTICDRPVAAVETELLQEMLMSGDIFQCYFDRDREPYRIHLEIVDTMKDFNEAFELEMDKRGLHKKAAQQRSCRFDVDLHRPSDYNQQKFDEMSTRWSSSQMKQESSGNSPTSSSIISFASTTNKSSMLPPHRILRAPTASSSTAKKVLDEESDDEMKVEPIDDESD